MGNTQKSSHDRSVDMGMTNDGLSYWQAESEEIELLDITIGDLLDRQAEAFSDREALVYSCYPEFEYVLKQGDIRALFFMASIRDHDCLATIRSLITSGNQQGEVTSERLPLLRSVCLLGTPPFDRLQHEDWRPLLFDEMVMSGKQISEVALSERQISVGPFDPAMIIYTSGTTGFPKGTLLTHHGLINNARLLAKRWGVDQDTVI